MLKMFLNIMDERDGIVLFTSSPEKRSLLKDSESEEESFAISKSMISNSRAKLMNILQQGSSTVRLQNTPRYIDISDNEEHHTGFTQTYQSFDINEKTPTFIKSSIPCDAIKIRKIKVKADALPEICICLTNGLSSLGGEMGTLPEVEWMTSLRDDVQYVTWRLRSNFQSYDYVVSIVDLEKFYPFIENRSFEAFFSNVFASYPQTNRFMYLTGVKKYVQKLQSMENKHFKETLRSGKLLTPDRLKKASWSELEMELCIAALSNKVKVSILPDGELGKSLVEMTKCIAWEPHANSQKGELGDASGISRIRTGKDLTDTWRQMLMAIPKVSDATATAIQLNYPTLHSLRYAFELHGSDALANLSLGKRSLGSAISSRIHAVFGKHSPDTAISN